MNGSNQKSQPEVMMRYLVVLAWIVSISNAALTPVPKIFNELGGEICLGEKAVIVVGEMATEPEMYAAEQLQAFIKKRFGLGLAIARESQITGAEQIIIIGQVKTNKLLAEYCAGHKVEYAASLAGFDGYVIETLAGTPEAIIICGANSRGVIYGQQTLGDMLERDGDKIKLGRVRVADWATIKWRGRPATQLEQHLRPGVMDSYLRARLNFIDLRGSVKGDGKGPLCFPHDELDANEAGQVIREAHKRGLFVYGVVMCGFDKDKLAPVYAMFERMIELGVDGLWISFDDPGPGENAAGVVANIIELGGKHGITGDAIAMTPPSGSYQYVDVEWNEIIAKVEGADEALWFFTRPPCKADLKAAREIGLKSKPACWHNWPRPKGGLLHSAVGGLSLYDREIAYCDVQPLSEGWEGPRYEELRDAGENASAVMMFSDGVTEEYGGGPVGYWGWDPQGHDWNETRKQIYWNVFGPGQVRAAERFDDRLCELKKLFVVGSYKQLGPELWPARLKNPNDRAKALRLIRELQRALTKIEKGAESESLLPSGRLENIFILPMRDVVSYGRMLATLDYPEYRYGDFKAEMLELIDEGKVEQAREEIESAGPEIASAIKTIRARLAGLKEIGPYLAQWESYVSGVEFWKEQLAGMQAAEKMQREKKRVLQENADEWVRRDFDHLLAGMDVKPRGKVLAEMPVKEMVASGVFKADSNNWAIGSYKDKAVLIAVGADAEVGVETAEIVVELQLPKKYSGRLRLEYFMNYIVEGEAAGDTRCLFSWANKRPCWMQDPTLGVRGNNLISLDIRDVAEPGRMITVRLQVVNSKPVKGFGTAALYGPVRIVEY